MSLMRLSRSSCTKNNVTRKKIHYKIYALEPEAHGSRNIRKRKKHLQYMIRLVTTNTISSGKALRKTGIRKARSVPENKERNEK